MLPERLKQHARRPMWRRLVLFSALFLSGCGQASQTPLPELTRVSQPLLTKAEQERAIRELEAERTKVNAQAVKSLNAAH